MDFSEIRCLNIFPKSVQKIQSIKIYKNKGTLPEAQYTFLIISSAVLLKMRNVSDKICEKMKTRILFSIIFFLNRAPYEIMWQNIVERGRPQMTI